MARLSSDPLGVSLGGAVDRLVAVTRAVDLTRMEGSANAGYRAALAVRHALLSRSDGLAEVILNDLANEVSDWGDDAQGAVMARVGEVRRALAHRSRPVGRPGAAMRKDTP